MLYFVHILEQKRLLLLAKLYHKCSSLTPGGKQLIRDSHKLNLSLYLSFFFSPVCLLLLLEAFSRKHYSLIICVHVSSRWLRALLALRYDC